MTKSILTDVAFKLPVNIAEHEEEINIDELTAEFDGDRLDKLIQLSKRLSSKLNLTIGVGLTLSAFRENMENARLEYSGIPVETTDAILKLIEEILLKGYSCINTGMQNRIKRIFDRFFIDLDKCLYGLYSHLEMIKYELDSSEQLDYWLTSLRQEIVQQLISQYCNDHGVNAENEIHLYNAFARDEAFGFCLPNRASALEDGFYNLDAVGALEKQKIKKLFDQRYSALSILNWLVRHMQTIVMEQVCSICKESYNEKDGIIMVESEQAKYDYNILREYVSSMLAEVGLGLDAILGETEDPFSYKLSFDGMSLPIFLHLFALNYFSIECVQEYIPENYSWSLFVAEVNEIISSNRAVAVSEKLAIFMQNLLACEMQYLHFFALQVNKSCSVFDDKCILNLLMNLTEKKDGVQVIRVLQILLQLEDFDLVRQYINNTELEIVDTMDLLIKGFTSLNITYDLQLSDLADEIVASISSDKLASVLEFVQQFHNSVAKLLVIWLAACSQLSELDHETIMFNLHELDSEDLIDNLLNYVQLDFDAVRVEMITKIVSYVGLDMAVNILKKVFFSGCVKSCGAVLQGLLKPIPQEMYYSILIRIVSNDDDVRFLDKEQLIAYFRSDVDFNLAFDLDSSMLLTKKIFIFEQLIQHSYYSTDLLKLLSAFKKDLQDNDEPLAQYHFLLYNKMLAVAVCSEFEKIKSFANNEILANNSAKFLGSVLGHLEMYNAPDLLIDDIIHKLSEFNDDNEVTAIEIAMTTSILYGDFIKLYHTLTNHCNLQGQKALLPERIPQLLEIIHIGRIKFYPDLSEDVCRADLRRLGNLLFFVLLKNNEQVMSDDAEAIAYILRDFATKRQYPLDEMLHKAISCMPETHNVPLKDVFTLLLRQYCCVCIDEDHSEVDGLLYAQVLFKIAETNHDYILKIFIEIVFDVVVETCNEETEVQEEDEVFVRLLAYLYDSPKENIISELQRQLDVLMQSDKYSDNMVARFIAQLFFIDSKLHLDYLLSNKYIEAFLYSENNSDFSRQIILCGIIESENERFLDCIYNENFVETFGVLYKHDDVVEVIVEHNNSVNIARILQLLLANGYNQIALKLLLAAKGKFDNILQKLFGLLQNNACTITLETINEIAKLNNFKDRAEILRAFLSVYGRQFLLDLLNSDEDFATIDADLLALLICSTFTHYASWLSDSLTTFNDTIYFLNNLNEKCIDALCCAESKVMDMFCQLLLMKREKLLNFIFMLRPEVLVKILLGVTSSSDFSKIDNIFPGLSEVVAGSYYDSSSLKELRELLLKNNNDMHAALKLVPEVFQITYLMTEDVVKLHGDLYDKEIANFITNKATFDDVIQMVATLHVAAHDKAAIELLLSLLIKHEESLKKNVVLDASMRVFQTMLSALNKINQDIDYEALAPFFYRLLLKKNKMLIDMIFTNLNTQLLSRILAKVKYQDLSMIESIFPEMSLETASIYYDKIDRDIFIFSKPFCLQDLKSALKLVPRQFWIEFFVQSSGACVHLLDFRTLLKAFPDNYLSDVDRKKIINWLVRFNLHNDSGKWLYSAVKECYDSAYNIVKYFDDDLLASVININGLNEFLELFLQEDVSNLLKLLIDNVDEEIIMASVPDMKSLLAILSVLPEKARILGVLAFTDNFMRKIIADGRDLPLLFDFLADKEKIFSLVQTMPNTFTSLLLSHPYDQWDNNACKNKTFCDLYHFAKIKLYCVDRIKGKKYGHAYGRLFGYSIEKKFSAVTSLLQAIKYDTQLSKAELKCLSQGRAGALYAEYKTCLAQCEQNRQLIMPL